MSVALENHVHKTVMSNMEHNVLQQLVFSVMHNIFGVLDVYAVRPWYSNDLVKSSRKISLSPKAPCY